MKGNAIRQDQERTRNLNEHSKPNNPQHKQRCETKGQARLRRAQKEFDRDRKSPEHEVTGYAVKRPGSVK